MAAFSSNAELVQAIAEALCGVPISKRVLADVQKKVDGFRLEFEAVTGVNPTEVRNQMRDIAQILKTASRAVADAPDTFENMVIEETGFRSLDLVKTLHSLSLRSSNFAKNFKTPAARDVNEKKLCAWYALRLMDEVSRERATTTPGAAFDLVASYVAELFTGESAPKMSHACREVLDRKFPTSSAL